jgi:hypothetical protein
VYREHSDVTPVVQGVRTDQTRKKPAGDSRLNPWTFQVLTDHRLTRKAVSVSIFLRNNFDMRVGFSSPSFRAIAAATGLSRGSAERAVRALIATGHLTIISGGGGPANSNIYRLTGGPR